MTRYLPDEISPLGYERLTYQQKLQLAAKPQTVHSSNAIERNRQQHRNADRENAKRLTALFNYLICYVPNLDIDWLESILTRTDRQIVSAIFFRFPDLELGEETLSAYVAETNPNKKERRNVLKSKKNDGDNEMEKIEEVRNRNRKRKGFRRR